MSRSNAPLALSVVSLTEPGDVDRTLFNITQFDDRDFGFNHDQTWAAMPFALRGILDPDGVEQSFVKAPVRIQRCITALCRLGRKNPLETKRFVDFPEAGLRTVSPIDWDPDVSVRVKACCWYVRNGRTVVPGLQPRKSPLSEEQLSVYVRLMRQAHCQGDWVDAITQIIDLAGDDEQVVARIIEESEIPPATDGLLARYVKTFVDAKRLADEARAKRPKKKKKEMPMGDLLGIKE